MIVTIYKPNGTKERRPMGYGGGLCNKATAPYEAREIFGQTDKDPTPEALQEPAVQPESVDTHQKAGHS